MRIASLSPAATEILFAMGLGDQIVCTDQFSNFPDEVKQIPHVRDHQNIQVDALQEHKPDLILTSTVIQEKLAVQLRSNFTVIHQDPRDLAGVFESIRQFGLIFDAQEQANAVILKMQQELNLVRKRAALLPKRPKLYIEEWHLPPMASGNWVPELARTAGGEQFPIKAGSLSREVTLKEVEVFDPDMMIISWCGAGDLPEKKVLTERAGWTHLRAIREGNVRVLDDSLLNRPGPRLVEGVQRLYGWMFEMLH